MTPRPWLIGESNPYGADPEMALYPDPPNSAGGRLCRAILGLTEAQYLRSFERRNLLSGSGAWSVYQAREAARRMMADIPSGTSVVLLGAKVWKAFMDAAHAEDRLKARGERGHPVLSLFEPFATHLGWTYLPHPSGRCLLWNEPGAIERARAALASAKIDLAAMRAPRPEDLPLGDSTTARPARCANCHLVIQGQHCPECGAP